MDKPTILFDLDGTLADNRQGIVESAIWAIKSACPNHHILDDHEIENKICKEIGPPHKTIFSKLFNDIQPERLNQLSSHYKERYASVGWSQFNIYPGVQEMLVKIHQGYRILLATVKAEFYAKRIIEHASIRIYFSDIRGRHDDGKYEDKSELVADYIKEYNLDPSQIVMVGDRRSDIIAGKKNGTKTVGVTYGFGTPEELNEADALCDSVEELESTFKILL